LTIVQLHKQQLTLFAIDATSMTTIDRNRQQMRFYCLDERWPPSDLTRPRDHSTWPTEPVQGHRVSTSHPALGSLDAGFCNNYFFANTIQPKRHLARMSSCKQVKTTNVQKVKVQQSQV